TAASSPDRARTTRTTPRWPVTAGRSATSNPRHALPEALPLDRAGTTPAYPSAGSAYPRRAAGGGARSVRVAADGSEGDGHAAMALADRAAGRRDGRAGLPAGLVAAARQPAGARGRTRAGRAVGAGAGASRCAGRGHHRGEQRNRRHACAGLRARTGTLLRDGPASAHRGRRAVGAVRRGRTRRRPP